MNDSPTPGVGPEEQGEGEVSYRVLDFADLEGVAAQHYRRKRRRRLLAFVTLPGLLLGTATIAAAYGTGLIGQTEPVATCTTSSMPAPERDSFEVEVLNSNDTNGLAGEVSGSLEDRDFVISSVGNADSSVYVKDVAIIYYGPEGEDNALLLQKQVPGAKLWNDNREGGDVRLVLGYGYDKLSYEEPKPPPAPSEIRVNVYNTTFQEGLAQDVADELDEREFKIRAVGNDPQASYLEDEVAIIRYGPEADGAAKRLAQQIDGATLKKVDRDEVSVDLVIGNDFQGLKAETEVPQVEPFERPAETIEKPCES